MVPGLGPHSTALLSIVAILQNWRMETRSSSTAPPCSTPWWPTVVWSLTSWTQLPTKVLQLQSHKGPSLIYGHNISDIHFLSQCLEDGLWSPVEVSCMFDSSSLVFSDWPAITISILCIIIIILVIIVCWAKGYTTCKPPTKPCFISKGVNASTIAHSVIDTDLIKSAMTSANYNPPLSTFHRCNI